MDYLLDTNIISQVFRKNLPLVGFITGLDFGFDATVYIEAIQGQITNVHKSRVRKWLDNYELLHYTPDISQRAIDLIAKYANSHNLRLPDALIAAACLEYNFELITYNQKDFRYISNLTIIVPPFTQI